MAGTTHGGLSVKDREALLNKRIDDAAKQFEGFTQKQTKFALAELKRTEDDLIAQLAKAQGEDGKIRKERLTTILKDVKRTQREIASTLDGAMNTIVGNTANRAWDDLAASFETAGLNLATAGVDFNRFNEHVFKYTTQRFGEDGLILSDRAWKFAEQQEAQLNTIVRNGIIQGHAVTDMTRYIVAAGIGSRYAVDRLVRTEVNTAYRTAFAYTAQQSPLVQYVQIIKGEADRPEHKCTIYSLEDNYGAGAGIFKPTDTKILNPHPNCTSYLLYVLIPEETQNAVQRQAQVQQTVPTAVDTTIADADLALAVLMQAKSTKEVQTWAVKNLPMNHVDLAGFDADLARDMVSQIYVLQQRFPEAMDSFQGIGTAQGYYKKLRAWEVEQTFKANVVRTKPDGTPMFPDHGKLMASVEAMVKTRKVSGNTNAFATRSGSGFDGVYINKNLAKDYDEFKKRKQFAYDSQWSMVGTPTGTISHEYGHMVDFWMQANHPEARKRVISEIYDVAKGQDVKWWRENISEYGKTNDLEFFAETFSDYIHNGDKAKDISKEVGRRLEAEFTKIRGGGN